MSARDDLARIIRPWTVCDDGGGFDHGSQRAADAVIREWLPRAVPCDCTPEWLEAFEAHHADCPLRRTLDAL